MNSAVRRHIRTGAAAVRVGIIGIAVASCSDGTCIVPPCALPTAVNLSVTSSISARTVDSVSVRATNTTNVYPCVGSPVAICRVFGGPGTYELDIVAPGFQSVHRTVKVDGAEPKNCGCGTTDTANISVVLVPGA